MLKNPLWLKIVDGILTIGIPGLITILEIKESSNVAYKLSFVSILVLLAAWLFLDKFILKELKTKLQSSVTTLELNYATGVGDKDKTLELWKKNKLLLIIMNSFTLLLTGIIIYVVFYGLAKGILKFLGAYIIIALSYLASFITKAIYTWFRKVN